MSNKLYLSIMPSVHTEIERFNVARFPMILVNLVKPTLDVPLKLGFVFDRWHSLVWPCGGNILANSVPILKMIKKISIHDMTNKHDIYQHFACDHGQACTGLPTSGLWWPAPRPRPSPSCWWRRAGPWHSPWRSSASCCCGHQQSSASPYSSILHCLPNIELWTNQHNF